MTKEIEKFCNEFERDVKAELREIKDTMERDRKKSRNVLREIRTSKGSLNKLSEDMKKTVDAVQEQNALLKK